jgi:hypothetical protein
MAKAMKSKGKLVKGFDYTEEYEKFDKKIKKKDVKGMKTAGIAEKLKESQKQEGYSKKPRVKPQKKVMKPVMGQKKVY